MTNLEWIEQAKKDPIFKEIETLQHMTKEEYFAKGYNKPFDPKNKHSKSKWWHLYDELYKKSPKWKYKSTYKYGDYEWDIVIFVGMEYYSTKHLEFVTNSHITCDDFRQVLFYNPIKVDVFDIHNPIFNVKKAINKQFVPQGVMGYLQMKHQIVKSELAFYYKHSIPDLKNCLAWTYDTIEKWLLRNMNIKANGYVEQAIKWVNKHGKPDRVVNFNPFDTSFMNYIDGDVDEVEAAFWNEMDGYPTNTIFVNL